MSQRDYYEVLGISRAASPDEVRQAYRQKAKQNHPDHNAGDTAAEQRFKEVQQAYEVLKDPDKRKLYDQFGHAGVNANTQAGEWRTAPGGQRVYTNDGPSGFGDIQDILRNFGFGGTKAQGGFGGGFEELFGSGGRQRDRSQETHVSLDVNTTARISFEQSIVGADIDIKLTSPEGAQQMVTIKVPAAVNDGQIIRLRGKGSLAPDGRRGDVLITIRIAEHAFYSRDGLDVYCDVPLTIAEATLGARIDVPTIHGRSTVAIPPSTPSGVRLRLKGEGITNPSTGENGHHYIRVNIVPPHDLSDNQSKLLLELQQELATPRDKMWWSKADQS